MMLKVKSHRRVHYETESIIRVHSNWQWVWMMNIIITTIIIMSIPSPFTLICKVYKWQSNFLYLPPAFGEPRLPCLWDSFSHWLLSLYLQRRYVGCGSCDPKLCTIHLMHTMCGLSDLMHSF